MAGRDEHDDVETDFDAATTQRKKAPADVDTPVTALDTPNRREPAAKFSESPLPIPERYRVKRRLGRGGMGDVLEAYDDHLGRDVAIKLLAPQHWPNRDIRQRLLREGRAAAVLDHPAVVKVYDLDPDGRYIVMELVRGDSLASRLERGETFSGLEARNMGQALCDALGAAHAAGIVHRDIKPANILFDDNGRVRLADFGVASVLDSELTATDAQIGTPAYMAPEQLRSSAVDGRADIYSTGATLFEAVTGTRLHGSKSVRDPRRAIIEACGDRGLARAITTAIADEPEQRFQNAAELSVALSRRGGERVLTIAMVAAFSIAIGVGVGVFAFGNDSDRVQTPEPAAAPSQASQPAPEKPAPVESKQAAADVADEVEPEPEEPVSAKPEPKLGSSESAGRARVKHRSSSAAKETESAKQTESAKDSEQAPAEAEAEAVPKKPEKKAPPVFDDW